MGIITSVITCDGLISDLVHGGVLMFTTTLLSSISTWNIYCATGLLLTCSPQGGYPVVCCMSLATRFPGLSCLCFRGPAEGAASLCLTHGSTAKGRHSEPPLPPANKERIGRSVEPSLLPGSSRPQTLSSLQVGSTLPPDFSTSWSPLEHGHQGCGSSLKFVQNWTPFQKVLWIFDEIWDHTMNWSVFDWWWPTAEVPV